MTVFFMLEQIGFTQAEEIYTDCHATNTNNLENIDDSEVIELVQELDPKRGVESLATMGLLN